MKKKIEWHNNDTGLRMQSEKALKKILSKEYLVTKYLQARKRKEKKCEEN